MIVDRLMSNRGTHATVKASHQYLGVEKEKQVRVAVEAVDHERERDRDDAAQHRVKRGELGDAEERDGQ